MEDKFKCLGNCFTCEALKDGRADEIVCPIRVQMVRTERIEAKMTKILLLLENGNVKNEKVLQSVEVEIGEGEEEAEEV